MWQKKNEVYGSIAVRRTFLSSKCPGISTPTVASVVIDIFFVYFAKDTIITKNEVSIVQCIHFSLALIVRHRSLRLTGYCMCTDINSG